MGRPRVYGDDKVSEILQLLAQGFTVRQIAAATGVSKSAVGRIVKDGR